jgi:hypothetical protein
VCECQEAIECRGSAARYQKRLLFIQQLLRRTASGRVWFATVYRALYSSVLALICIEEEGAVAKVKVAIARVQHSSVRSEQSVRGSALLLGHAGPGDLFDPSIRV